MADRRKPNCPDCGSEVDLQASNIGDVYVNCYQCGYSWDSFYG